MIGSNAKNIPVFWGHGSDDPVVRYECMSSNNPPFSSKPSIYTALISVFSPDGTKSISLLQSLPNLSLPLLANGTKFARPGIRFETYKGMGHSLCGEEVEDLGEWLGECLPPV
jgi:lysophospholipase II